MLGRNIWLRTQCAITESGWIPMNVCVTVLGGSATKWPRFLTLLIPFSSHKGVFRLRGKPLRSTWAIRTGFKRKTDLRNWDLLTTTIHSFHWNPNTCLSRAGGNCVSTYLHSFAHKTTNMGGDIYGLNQTDFKKVYHSWISVLFWKRKAFEKNKEVLNYNGWKNSPHKTAPQDCFPGAAELSF